MTNDLSVRGKRQKPAAAVGAMVAEPMTGITHIDVAGVDQPATTSRIACR